MMKRLLLILFVCSSVLQVAANDIKPDEAYKTSAEYLTLRDSMRHAFNDGDSSRFNLAVKRLERYLLEQKDLHAYYTQRCNEIVFLLNRQNIFEAYKLAKQLSAELTDRKMDSEMYMAINMMGHIYRYCGDTKSAAKCFWDVIHRMEKEGYRESEPAIYMNLVNIVVNKNPEEALQLIEQALEIARETSPDRTFDIETRRTLVYYHMGDMPRFLEGYKAYKEGREKGLSSVHSRSLEVYYQASQGHVDEAVRLAMETADDAYETAAGIYANAGRWQEAYHALQKRAAESDSINSLILSGSMQGIQEELRSYEAMRRVDRIRLYALAGTVVLLLLLALALVYIVQTRRHHLREMKKAYERIVESDKMKTIFMQNVSHEVRTPLNVISGFAQILAADYELSPDERRHIAGVMSHNTHRITTMIDDVLDMSVNDVPVPDDELTSLPCNEMLRSIALEFRKDKTDDDPELHFDTTLSDDFMVTTSESVLQRVLHPLLDNAVKNAPHGMVTLRATVADDQLVLHVEDNGCGIPADKAEQIFERFAKLDSFKEGLGLGLPTSRMMARRLGGDVRLDTSYTGGARFVVTLPLKKG
jgi:signal transduction histidine kinase